MEDWDKEESDPDEVPVPLLIAKKKWEDEDVEEDEIKESWEESEEEDGKSKSKPSKEPVKKRIPVEQKIAEREAKNKGIAEKAAEAKQQDFLEDPVERKNRLHQLEVKSDLENAANTFGVDLNDEISFLETINPKTKEEFEEFSRILVARISKHEKQGPYLGFINTFFRELCLPLKDVDVRKVSGTLYTLANEKTKALKDVNKGKKKGKPSKPSLTAGKFEPVDTTNYGSLDDDLDEFDDFM
ncbi:hypothetical protein G9A89_015124 [Geosiphon pyriformis]|nr:hypothetical protein G9A89_015124 [Geosiphon pyriformis]